MLRNPAEDLASASTSTKNGTSNIPSCPIKRMALRTSSKLRLGFRNSRVIVDLLWLFAIAVAHAKGRSCALCVPPHSDDSGKTCRRLRPSGKADHLQPFPAGWNAGEDMVDGPGPVGFDAAPILFVAWCADGCATFIVPDADHAVVPLAFGFIYVSGHDRGLSWSPRHQRCRKIARHRISR